MTRSASAGRRKETSMSRVISAAISSGSLTAARSKWSCIWVMSQPRMKAFRPGAGLSE